MSSEFSIEECEFLLSSLKRELSSQQLLEKVKVLRIAQIQEKSHSKNLTKLKMSVWKVRNLICIYSKEIEELDSKIKIRRKELIANV